MRKYLIALTAAAVFIATTPAFARPATVSGKLVDEGCGLKEASAKSAMPADCQTECAKRGEPVALVTSDGKVYRVGGGLAANKNAKLVAHMGKTVQITGEVTEAGGKRVIASDRVTLVK